MNGTITKLSGVTVGEAQKNIKKFGCKDVMTYELVREPHNPHDPNAIRVTVGPYYMGYIPKTVSVEFNLIKTSIENDVNHNNKEVN